MQALPHWAVPELLGPIIVYILPVWLDQQCVWRHIGRILRLHLWQVLCVEHVLLVPSRSLPISNRPPLLVVRVLPCGTVLQHRRIWLLELPRRKVYPDDWPVFVQ